MKAPEGITFLKVFLAQRRVRAFLRPPLFDRRSGRKVFLKKFFSITKCSLVVCARKSPAASGTSNCIITKDILGALNLLYTGTVWKINSLTPGKYFPNAKITICEPLESESMKLFCNAFYATKIQFFTEMKLLCDSLEIEYNNVIEIKQTENNCVKELFQFSFDFPSTSISQIENEHLSQSFL